MRLVLPFAVAACALLASGCSNSCQELGNRLCDCTPVGTTKSACERNVRNQIDRLNPGKDDQEICSQKLDTCFAPDGIEFCDWLDGRCGKSACGMSEENWTTLSGVDTEGNPLTPDPADPTKPLCPK